MQNSEKKKNSFTSDVIVLRRCKFADILFTMMDDLKLDGFEVHWIRVKKFLVRCNCLLNLLVNSLCIHMLELSENIAEPFLCELHARYWFI